jgi:hypothetical protein
MCGDLRSLFPRHLYNSTTYQYYQNFIGYSTHIVTKNPTSCWGDKSAILKILQ